jgi:hypothetical protein
MAASSDPTKDLADVEEIAYRRASSGNRDCAPHRELMGLEIPYLFDFAVAAVADDVPDSRCGMRPPLLRYFFVDPIDQGWRFDLCFAPPGVQLLLIRSLVKLLFQVGGNVFRVERLNVPPSQSAILDAEHHSVAANQSVPVERDFEDRRGVY